MQSCRGSSGESSSDEVECRLQLLATTNFQRDPCCCILALFSYFLYLPQVETSHVTSCSPLLDFRVFQWVLPTKQWGFSVLAPDRWKKYFFNIADPRKEEAIFGACTGLLKANERPREWTQSLCRWVSQVKRKPRLLSDDAEERKQAKRWRLAKKYLELRRFACRNWVGLTKSPIFFCRNLLFSES